uniref:Integrase catalytic domain-containing protein n=1 Tax=Oryzias melastigma TaxID=30732 RepID=A0A3B3DJS6_ORYME
MDSKDYLLVVDYFSHFVEISIFARHCIPEVLMTDNGPQFSGSHFQTFAACYGFEHVTSSPRFPQSNGEADRAVQTVKRLLKKSADPYRASLAYRAMPLQNGYSPAELLMGRELRTTVPALPSLLDPTLPDYHALEAKEREKRQNDANIFDKRHKSRNLEPLVPGEKVWVTDAKAQGTVISAHKTPRSYYIQGPQGTLRRNRHHLVSLQNNSEGVGAEEPVGEDSPIPAPTDKTPVCGENITETVHTQSGRVVRKPERLNL